jgi:hypothetical protein
MMKYKLLKFCGELVGPLLVGILAGWVSFGVIFVFFDSSKVDYSVLMNIVIACASVIAVVVQASGQYTQEKARRWELRKGIVFNLLNALTDHLKVAEEMFDIYMRLNNVQDDEDEEDRIGLVMREEELGKKRKGLRDVLNNEVQNVMNVYQPIFTREFTEYIKKYEINFFELTRLSKQEWTAYEDLTQMEIRILFELQTYLFAFVADESGLN